MDSKLSSSSLCLFAVVAMMIAVVGSSTSCSDDPVPSNCTRFVAATRDAQFACGLIMTAPARENEIRRRLALSCAYTMSAPGQGVTAKMLDFCAKAALASCGDTTSCLRIGAGVRGTLTDGSPCGLSSQCASGVCQPSGSEGSGFTRCGQCVSIGGESGDADPCGGCGPDALCVDAGDGLSTRCVPIAPRAAGEECEETGSRCQEGLACVNIGGGSSSSGEKPKSVCLPFLDVGATCGGDGSARCRPPLQCANGKCAQPGAQYEPCMNGACAPGLFCEHKVHTDTVGLCVPFAFGPASSTCDLQSERCVKGWCTAADANTAGRCVDPVKDGDTCSSQVASGSPTNAPTCDVGADCIENKCQIFDPGACR